ncbi:hypothetical protein DMENIID0001_066680 [Sergentomyia squamirostris]
MKAVVLLILLVPFVHCQDIESDVELVEPKSTNSLDKDLQDFMALIPTGKVLNTALTYVFKDKQVKELYEYVTKSPEFKELFKNAMETSDVRNLLALLDSYGLPVTKTLNDINVFLGFPPFKPPKVELRAPYGGVNGLIYDILRLLPRQKIIALYYDKINNSEAFQRLINNLTSEQTIGATIRVATNPEVQKAYAALNKRGVDIFAIGREIVVYFLDLY